MKKRLMALLMAMVLVFGMSTTALAANSPVGDNTPVGKITVSWSKTEPWTVEFSDVAIGAGEYEYEYYVHFVKDGKYVDMMYVEPTGEDTLSKDVSSVIKFFGDGKYTVEIERLARTETSDGWVTTHRGEATEKTYVKPEKQLASPTNFKVDLENDKITFDQVEGVTTYELAYIFTYADREPYPSRLGAFEDDNLSDGKVEIVIEGLSELLEMAEETYKDRDIRIEWGVRAASSNIDEIADSEYAKYLLFENKLTSDQVKENFDKAFENVEEEPYVAYNALSNVSNDTITELLTTDADFAEKVEKLDQILEEECKDMLGDGYKGATSSTDVVDISKVKVVGLALNSLNAMESAELKIADVDPEAKAEVPEGYKNGVQLDISLLIDGEAKEDLNVPVTITMPIPAGVATKDLVILHYHGDATEPVVIVPTVNEDGTMTFIVDGFSTFVVANQAATATAPKTGDSSATVAICSLLLLAAGVVITKRNAFAK